jgi:hypothetical protein
MARTEVYSVAYSRSTLVLVCLQAWEDLIGAGVRFLEAARAVGCIFGVALHATGCSCSRALVLQSPFSFTHLESSSTHNLET